MPPAVSRIPMEILSIIFEVLAFSNPEVDESSSHLYGHQPWLAVSQVCRFWRNASLSYPPIWGCIYGQINVRLAELFLERAKTSPIYIRSWSPKTNAPTMSMLLRRPDQYSRIKEIHLEDCCDEWLSLLAHRQLPLLETLELDASNRLLGLTDFTNARPPKAQLAPPEPGMAPPLRHLILTDFQVALMDPHFSLLRTLSLRLSEGILWSPRSASSVLRDLQKMNLLETLELVSAVDILGNVPKDLVVELPRLTRVHLEVQEPRALMMLSHISCPSLRYINLSAEKSDTVDVRKEIVNLFCSRMPGKPSSWDTTLHIQPSYDYSYESTVTIFPDPNVSHDDAAVAPYQLSLEGLALPSIFPSSPSTLVLRPIPHLRTEEAHWRDPLLEFLRSLASVEVLRIHDMETLITVLTIAQPSVGGKSKKKSHPQLCLPSIKRIVAEFDQVKYKTRNVKKLKKVLAARKGIGAGIKTLKIDAEGFDEHDMELLRPEVGVLEFELEEEGEQ
ncbi:hypothetical protein ONZ45_g11838 [Pleurotus djamor]|nr:hypothetical protein ONZ45_g11838 [Pleurotus djamor]